MATLGIKRRIYIVSNDSTYTWLAGEQNNSVNLTSDKIDVSDKSTDWKQYIAGTKGGSISASIFTDEKSSSQQKAFFDALEQGQTVKVFVGELGEASTPSSGVAAECVIDSISETNNIGEVSSRDLALTINGKPTFY